MTAGEFRNGVTFEMDGQVQQVIEFQHVKPGKGAAFVRVKMKNVVTGAVTETSFNPTAKFEEAFVERREMQYLYNDGDLYYFMDNETYEQIPISKDAQLEEHPLDVRKVSGSNPLMSTNSNPVRNDGIFSIFKTFRYLLWKMFWKT